MGGGGDNKQYNLNLRKAFADTPDSRFESYVDSRGDLANAWRMIDTYQKGGDMSGFAMHGNMTPEEQAQYWIRKAEGGRFNKADFGRFHAAEDKSLLEGSYPGGTEVRKGTDAYSKYFPEGTTRYDQFSSGGSERIGNTVFTTPVKSPIEEAAERNIYFPMLVPEYSAPQALDYSAYTSMSPFGGDGGLLYQPGTQQYREAYPVADNILSYQPPEIGFPQVTYSRPVVLGIMEEGGEGGGGSDKKKKDKKKNGDPGSEEGRDSRYGGDGPGVDVSKAVAGLFGLQDFAEWGDPVFGDSGGDDADAGDTSGESFGGGDIHGW